MLNRLICWALIATIAHHPNSAWCESISPYDDLESFMTEAKSSESLLPKEILNRLTLLKQNQLEENYVLIRNLPVDQNLCNTPEFEYPPLKNTFVSEFYLSIVGKFLGEPFNYIQEEMGNIYRNIRPTKINADAQTSDSSKVILELHTEIAFHPFKPDYLLLYCLRTDRDSKAFTLTSSLKKILVELDSETIEELRKKQFITGIDVSFGNPDKTKFCPEPIPVLYDAIDGPMITYDLDLMTAPSEEARLALAKLKNAIIHVQHAILLQPGDLLVLDNKRIVHSRTAFQAYFDGYDRWLQRVYVSTDKEFAESISKNGRIINTQF